MTAAQRHPSWCAPDHCRAYAGEDWEPVHRSEPALLHLDRGTFLGAYLTEPVGYPGDQHIELVAVPEPLTGPVWQVNDPSVVQLALPIDVAAALVVVLRRLIRAAMTP